MNGVTKSFLPKGYNFKTISSLNLIFWEKHQNTSFSDAIDLVAITHKTIMDTLETFTNEELFTKKYYKWTGTTSLGSYAVSTLPSHYDWAMKKVNKHIKLEA